VTAPLDLRVVLTIINGGLVLLLWHITAGSMALCAQFIMLMFSASFFYIWSLKLTCDKFNKLLVGKYIRMQ